MNDLTSDLTTALGTLPDVTNRLYGPEDALTLLIGLLVAGVLAIALAMVAVWAAGLWGEG